MERIHRDKKYRYCDVYRVTLKGNVEFKKHLELEHSEMVSPKTKKQKHDQVYKLLEENSLQQISLYNGKEDMEMDIQGVQK